MQNKDKSNLASEIISYSSLWNASLKVLEKQIPEKNTRRLYKTDWIEFIFIRVYLFHFILFVYFISFMKVQSCITDSAIES